MPNIFAYLILFVWPVVSIILYRKISIEAATFWIIVGGYMFLPQGAVLALPGLPSLDKDEVCAVSALIGYAFNKNTVFSMKGIGVAKFIFAAIIINIFFTSFLNSEPIYWPYPLNGMSFHDAISFTIQFLLTIIVPFFLGWKVFRTFDSQHMLFEFFVVAALFYSLLVLFEIRISPQLNTWVYGYYPSGFLQSIRGSSFRATVFMGHGLLVAIFLSVATICAVGLWKSRIRALHIFSPAVALLLLFMVLVLDDCWASIVYAIVAFFCIKFLSFKMQHSLSVVIVLISILYPMSYVLENSFQDKIIEVIYDLNPVRAQSLDFRFQNEKQLFERAQERILFGWGNWGRNRVYKYGRDVTVTDGNWIILLGTLGLLGYLSHFLLLVVPVIKAHSISRKLNTRPEQTLLAMHALLVSLLFVDQIPNSSLGPWTFLIFGSLLGRSQDIVHVSAQKVGCDGGS